MFSSYDSIFVAFFRKVFAYCVAYAKEKKEKLETLLDWLRRLVIRKKRERGREREREREIKR